MELRSAINDIVNQSFLWMPSLCRFSGPRRYGTPETYDYGHFSTFRLCLEPKSTLEFFQYDFVLLNLFKGPHLEMIVPLVLDGDVEYEKPSFICFHHEVGFESRSVYYDFSLV